MAVGFLAARPMQAQTNERDAKLARRAVEATLAPAPGMRTAYLSTRMMCAEVDCPEAVLDSELPAPTIEAMRQVLGSGQPVDPLRTGACPPEGGRKVCPREQRRLVVGLSRVMQDGELLGVAVVLNSANPASGRLRPEMIYTHWYAEDPNAVDGLRWVKSQKTTNHYRGH
jgi:hypothetical protein